ncbi:MAG: RDD family protein [Armatimonadota bacterium]|nr:RDD family protein [Armatimonadota bacterium]
MTRQVTIVTPENAEISYTLAGIGSRMLAGIIDTLIQLATLLLIIVPLQILAVRGIFSRGITSVLSGWLEAVVVIASLLLFWGYYIWFETARNGQTPGKKKMRLRVVRDNGQPIDFSCAAIRNLLRVIDFSPILYTVGLITMFVSPANKRLGDYAAETIVVKENAESGIGFGNPVPVGGGDSEIATQGVEVGDLTALSKEDYEAVKRFIERKSELPPATVAELAHRMALPIMAKMDVERPNGEYDYVRFIEAIYTTLEQEKKIRGNQS